MNFWKYFSCSQDNLGFGLTEDTLYFPLCPSILSSFNRELKLWVLQARHICFFALSFEYERIYCTVVIAHHWFFHAMLRFPKVCLSCVEKLVAQELWFVPSAELWLPAPHSNMRNQTWASFKGAGWCRRLLLLFQLLPCPASRGDHTWSRGLQVRSWGMKFQRCVGSSTARAQNKQCVCSWWGLLKCSVRSVISSFFRINFLQSLLNQALVWVLNSVSHHGFETRPCDADLHQMLRGLGHAQLTVWVFSIRICWWNVAANERRILV